MSVCVGVCRWIKAQSPVCNKSWLLDPTQELTLEQIDSCVLACRCPHSQPSLLAHTEVDSEGSHLCPLMFLACV